LPTSDIEEREPAPVAAVSITPVELRHAESGAVSDSVPSVPKPVEAPGVMQEETVGSSLPHLHPVEVPTLGVAAGPAEQALPSTGGTERLREQASPDAAPQPEPERPDRTVIEQPSTPRRGWWQRLIQS